MPKNTPESCQPCRRQKRRCDRASRLTEEDSRCTRCAKQGRDCLFEPDVASAYKRTRSEHQSPSTEPSTHGEQLAAVQTPLGSNTTIEELQACRDAPMEHRETSPLSFPEADATILSPDAGSVSGPQSQGSCPVLSQNGSLFLHRVFGDLGMPSSAHRPATAGCPEPQNSDSLTERWRRLVKPKPPIFRTDRSNAFRLARSHVYQEATGRTGGANRQFFGDLFRVLSIKDYMDSLHAYFDFAGLCHTFIPEDAFWQDYFAGRCGPPLLLAIACRGIPFTTAKDKWNKQQLLALSCVEWLMRTGTVRDDAKPMRLDDLEAMALMIDFKFDDAHVSSTLSWKPFMTYDALVLMTLQSRSRGPRASDPSATLSGADERFALLYWHVYALDSFNSLDCKSISLIPDDGTRREGLLRLSSSTACGEVAEAGPASAEDLGYGAEGYHDAVLSLAIIARKITMSLCNATVKDEGIEYADIPALYEQLRDWRNNILPSDLHRPIDRETETPAEHSAVRGSTPIPASRQSAVRRAVLWALEINCYLQIGDCVAQYGLRERGSLDAELAALNVEYESHAAVLEAVNLANAIRKRRPDDWYSQERPLVDIAPPILRNTCADACKWVCSRGTRPSRVCETESRAGYSTLPHEAAPQPSEQQHQRQRRANFGSVAKTLRDSVAEASSYRDTEQLLGILDDQLAFLQDD